MTCLQRFTCSGDGGTWFSEDPVLTRAGDTFQRRCTMCFNQGDWILHNVPSSPGADWSWVSRQCLCWAQYGSKNMLKNICWRLNVLWLGTELMIKYLRKSQRKGGCCGLQWSGKMEADVDPRCKKTYLMTSIRLPRLRGLWEQISNTPFLRALLKACPMNFTSRWHSCIFFSFCSLGFKGTQPAAPDNVCPNLHPTMFL